jgi:hypothetical protein
VEGRDRKIQGISLVLTSREMEPDRVAVPNLLGWSWLPSGEVGKQMRIHHFEFPERLQKANPLIGKPAKTG